MPNLVLSLRQPIGRKSKPSAITCRGPGCACELHLQMWKRGRNAMKLLTYDVRAPQFVGLRQRGTLHSRGSAPVITGTRAKQSLSCPGYISSGPAPCPAVQSLPQELLEGTSAFTKLCLPCGPRVPKRCVTQPAAARISTVSWLGPRLVSVPVRADCSILRPTHCLYVMLC